MESLLLPEVDFACPICLERLKDPFVTQCGHSFCYSCITTHLQNKTVCPCCSDYLTQDKVFPNYLLNKAVENVAKAKVKTEGTLMEQLQAAITSRDSALGLADVDALLETLEEKKCEMQKQKKENNLELLLHFLNHSKSSKVNKLWELQGELHILDKDIHHVEAKQQKALPGPGPLHPEAAPSAPALPTLPTLASHTWLQSRMQAWGAERAPSVVVEDVSGVATADMQPGGTAGQAGRRGGEGSAWQAGGTPRGSPTSGARAATPASGLYQPNGQHLSTSVLGLSGSAAGIANSEQPQVGKGVSADLGQSTRQGVLLQSNRAPTHCGAAPPLLPHNPGAGTSLGDIQASSPPPWPPPSMATDQAAASRAGGQPQPPPHRGVPADGGAPAAAGRDSPSSVTTDSGGTTNVRRSSGVGGTSGGMRAQALSHKRPFESQYEDLQQHYLRMRQRQMGESKRRRGEAGVPLPNPDAPGGGVTASQRMLGSQAEGEPSGATGSSDGEGIEPGDLQEFSRMLSMTTRRSKLEVIASLPGASQNTSAAILSSVAFDKHALHFATAGVSKRISVYNYEDAVATYAPGQAGEVVERPQVQLRSRSKLSCLSWNCFQESHLMSSDYEGVIMLWDTATLQTVTEYEAHNKRVWSVDFCPTHAQLLASGSDDGRVKVWAMNQSSSVADIDVRANVCSVKYSPTNEHELAVGSADHNVLVYDTRRCAAPLQVLSGHKKAVSYVVYLGDGEVVSASTDSSLRLWSIGEGKAVRKYEGHINEKNFVGLSAEGDFVACGSETSHIYVFYRAMSRPITRTLFSPGPSRSDAASRSNSQFISALCWKPRDEKKILVAANSQGGIKILQLQAS